MKCYLDYLQQLGITADADQLRALEAFAELDYQLTRSPKLYRFIKKKQKEIKGIYLWGNVGRGKTYLMDLFFNQLQTERKTRMHFQRFMKNIHHQLFKLSGHQTPLKQVAHEFAKNVDIICLDELHIEDIADAMLLGELFFYLHKHSVILVTTSNLPPEQLYLKGLNRTRFLPTIEHLKTNCQVICLDGGKDYRLEPKLSHSVFFFGSPATTHLKLLEYYQNITHEAASHPGTIYINDRAVHFQGQKEGVIWFDFHEICEKPRSQYDYIDLAQSFHTLFISNIPQLDDGCQKEPQLIENINRTRRFISLIDELYDRSVNLAASFETELSQIYLGSKLSFLFRRTHSRLIEMQTHDYQLRPHQPF